MNKKTSTKICISILLIISNLLTNKIIYLSYTSRLELLLDTQSCKVNFIHSLQINVISIKFN